MKYELFQFHNTSCQCKLTDDMGYFHRVFTQIFLRPIIHYPIIIHPGTIVFTSLECAKTLQISDCRGRFFKIFSPDA